MVSSSLDGEVRRAELQAQLEKTGTITLAEASEQLGVSEMTIRRDLELLEEQGVARRVRGGAVAVRAERFAQRRQKAGRAKTRIAEKCLPLIPRSGAIVMDASSTVHRLGQTITATDLSVVTCGLETFRAMVGRPGIRPYLTGGEIEAETDSFIGQLARQAVSSFNYSRAFISPTCLDVATGASEATLEGAAVKQSMRASASSLVLAVDSTKLGLRAIARGLPLDKIDVLVTELEPDDHRLAPYRDLVEVI